MTPKIGFIGAGNMATALAQGFVAAGLVRCEDAFFCDILHGKADELARLLGGRAVESIEGILRASDIVILSVKPQNAGDVFSAAAPFAQPRHLFISIMAGVPAKRIERAIGGAPRVIRVMPNTPALVGAGAAGLARGQHASPGDLDTALELFRAVGVAVAVKESDLDAVTALSGSGPAYFFKMMEALVEAGVTAGLERRIASSLALQTALGAARLALQSDEPPAVLRERVTSKGGTTAAGLAALDEGGFNALIDRCVQAAKARSIELGNAFEPDPQAS